MQSFWANHGILFLLGIALIPRFTLFFSILFCGLVSGGFFWWLGFFIAPHLLVAILATTSYWQTNPVLCIIAWMVALGGTGAESRKIVKISRYH